MNLQINCIYHGFKLIEEKFIGELSGLARYFIHEKSGASLVQIANEDSQKVFTISFKTPPRDNTGVAHIVEHAVCCASKKYPLKDTFIEMDKGSLNTSLNACTYKDMTMYYCASQNNKDLMNLMEVYMDLVLNPLIYTRPYIFKQEGWHYALESKKEAITYNGIVYNEMKGDYSEPSTLMEYEIHKALYPDTVYAYDAGGVPSEIITLTEEDFLAFHKTHYHPSNCNLYLYGDGDLLAQLALLDTNYLCQYEKQPFNLEIPMQEPFDSPRTVYKQYPITDEESLDEKSILSLSFVVGETLNTELRLAFQILEHMLLKSAASPLTAALVGDGGLGKVIEESGYDTGKRQPTFSIVLNGSEGKNSEAFKIKVFEILHALASEGLDPDLIEAAISTATFALEEADTPWEPKGLLYSEDVQTSILYGGHPFTHLSYKSHLEKMNKLKYQGYFESIITKYLLDNPHYILLVMEPNKDLQQLEETALAKELAAYKQSLSKKEIISLIDLNHELDAIQDLDNTPEDLALLPTLGLQDIQPLISAVPLVESQEGEVQIIFNPQDTHGIIYTHLLFDASSISQEDISYLGLLANTLTYLSTQNYHYSALENEINKQTGGLNCTINAYTDSNDTDSYQPMFKITSKSFTHKLSNLIDLLYEVTTQGLFNEKEKLKEILDYIKYELERSFVSSPEYRVSKRLYSYFSASAVYEDHVAGIAYYRFLSDLIEHFDRDFEKIITKLKAIYTQLIQKNHLMLSITGQSQDYAQITQHFQGFINRLPSGYYEKPVYTLIPPASNEAYLTANGVQAIAQGFNFKKSGYAYNGTLNVISNLLNSTYLWDKVRLQGGAYGCDLSMSGDGNLLICSYCDPGLVDTLKVYKGIGSFLRKLDLDDAELLKYIIGTIGGLDYPLTMEQKSERALAHYLCHITYEMIQKEREEVLNTTLESIRASADLFDTMVKENMICVIGNTNELTKNKKLFNKLVTF
ncbi:MAG: insulinase family protein [Cellulosilyticaceae bacterium]